MSSEKQVLQVCPKDREHRLDICQMPKALLTTNYLLPSGEISSFGFGKFLSSCSRLNSTFGRIQKCKERTHLYRFTMLSC